MAEGKKSFVLYADYIHTFELLDNEQAGKLIKHLLEYVNDKNPEFPPDQLLLKIAFEPIKRQLKRDLIDWSETRQKRSEAGHLGGIKSAESRKSKQNEANEAKPSKSKQDEANQAVNVNVTVNDTVTDNVKDNTDHIYSSNSNEFEEVGEKIIGIKSTGGLNALVGKKKKVPRKKKESDWPQKLFNNIKVKWWEWFMERTGSAPKFGGGSAKAIDHIRNYLISEGKKMNYAEESMIYDFGIEQFSLILSRWEELKQNNFLYEGVDILDINKNLNRIINFYNNGRQTNSGYSSNGATRKNTSDERVTAIANWSLGFLKDGFAGNQTKGRNS